MKKRIFSVDGNFYLHRCAFTLKTSRPIEEVLPKNFVGLVAKDICAIKATHLLVCFDGPSVFRYKLYPDYKGNRREGGLRDEESGSSNEVVQNIYSYLPATHKLLNECGIAWKQNKTHEADDLLASCAHTYVGDDIEVVLGTADKDSYQCYLEHVRGYNSTLTNPFLQDAAWAEKKKKVKIAQMVMFQTLHGDSLDNIPQLLSEGKARAACNKWGSFAEWFEKGSKEDRSWLRTHQTKLHLNKQLVELKTNLSLPEIDELRPEKRKLLDMPKAWYAMQDYLYPKAKGLFGK